jgi:LCP family protein required for cell wall assembly
VSRYDKVGKHSRLDSSGAPRRKRRTRHVFLIVATVLLVLLGGAGVWYLHALDSALSLGEDEGNVKTVLADANPRDPFYVLVLGSDSRENSGTSNLEAESGENERSDVMTLVRVDASDNKVTMLTIPRDTPYTDSDGHIIKINETFHQDGATGAIQAVERLTGVKVSHFVEVRFSGFEGLVDSLGGIEVDVPIELAYKDALTGEQVALQPGLQVLNGQQAQILARSRHEYGENQEAKRQQTVRAIMNAMFNRIKEVPFWQMPDLMLDMARNVGTDISVKDFLVLASSLRGHTTMYSGTGPSRGDFIQSLDGAWFCYQDDEGWRSVMNVVDSGGDPGAVDYAGDTAIIPGTDETVIVGH